MVGYERSAVALAVWARLVQQAGHGLENRPEREVLLHSPAMCQMAGGIIRVYLYTLCLSLNLDPSG